MSANKSIPTWSLEGKVALVTGSGKFDSPKKKKKKKKKKRKLECAWTPC
jgi:hypothetical protein